MLETLYYHLNLIKNYNIRKEKTCSIKH